MPITIDKRPGIGLDPVTVDWSKFNRNETLNPMEIPVGSVAYYITKSHNRYWVEWGIVYQHYHDCIILQKIAPSDKRMVISEFFKEPVPFDKFPYQTEWRKLPKGWSWDTRLYEITMRDFTDDERVYFQSYDPAKPETLIEGYNKGFLVNVRDIPHESIDEVIEKENGYKLVRKGKDEWPLRISNHAPCDTVGVNFYQCFKTYAEANKACNNAYQELLEQSAMTDLEWSISLIDKDIDRWAALHGISDENKARAREHLMQFQHLENLETRVVSEGLQFKYWKATKWMTVPIN